MTADELVVRRFYDPFNAGISKARAGKIVRCCDYFDRANMDEPLGADAPPRVLASGRPRTDRFASGCSDVA